ncbi:unnamed protein product, partial [Amoebophrya sp. A25]
SVGTTSKSPLSLNVFARSFAQYLRGWQVLSHRYGQTGGYVQRLIRDPRTDPPALPVTFDITYNFLGRTHYDPHKLIIIDKEMR